MRPVSSRLAVVVAVLVGVMAVSGCVAEDPEPTTVDAVASEVIVRVDDVDRKFLIRAPEHTTDEQLPVVVAFHGATGNKENFELYTGFTDSIESDRFIAVYPDGSEVSVGGKVWNAGGCCGETGVEPADDIAFVEAILDELPSYGADPERVYVSGFSNGGMMSYRVACELGDRIAGVASVGGSYNVTECPTQNVLPLVIVHGTADDTVPYEGGLPVAEQNAALAITASPSVWDAVDVWMGRDSCDTSGTESVLQEAPAATVTRVAFDDCDGDSFISVNTVDGGGHIWPRAGDNTIDASEVILDAFIRADPPS
ncbi:MAG TPA: PHB depolymerase family esterase [Glaciihabitans sp.]|jgi:polyhydroxybutyrate depolymerase|nr:PHB depolymerase family esterase [Glaciihabitans sp.]